MTHRTESSTVNITFSDNLGSNEKTIKLDYPAKDLTLAMVENTFAPAFSGYNSSSVDIFRANSGAALTKIKSAQYVDTVTVKTDIE